MVIATAVVRGDHQILWQILDGGVVHGGILFLHGGELIGGVMLVEVRITEHAPRAVIQLNIAAAGLIQCHDQTMEGLGVVVGKLVVILLGVAVELVHGSDVLRAEQLRIQLCRGRNGLACNGGVVFELLDELEMLNERVGRVEGDLAGQACGFGAGLLIVEEIALIHRHFFHAGEAPHAVEMPPATAEFTVGDDVQTGSLLLGDQFGNGIIFHGLECGLVNLACCEIGASLLEFCRTQV